MHSDRTDRINAYTKLAMHRMVARMLSRDPSLLKEAQEALGGMRERLGDAPYMDEWALILDQPVEGVRRQITARTEEMDRLRITSPFMTMWRSGIDFRDYDLRKRLWKLSDRVATMSERREASCPQGMRAA